MKKLFSIMFLLIVFYSAKAYRIEYGRNVVISHAVYEDFYIAGGTITINAPVYGDLVIAGGNIFINDSVKNDLILAGGTAQINGYVGDDIRCAGGELYVLKNVGGDLVITGGQVEVANGVIVYGDLITSGGKITINGLINGNVKSFAGEFTLNGMVAKNLEIRGTEITINGSVGGASVLSAHSLLVGSNAAFSNNVRYWSKKGTADLERSVMNGQAIYDPALKMKSDQWYFLGRATLLGMFWYIGMVFLLIALLQYFFSNTFQKAGNTAFDATAKSLGYGFLFVIGVPVLIVILIITLIGLPVGLFLLFIYVGLIIMATIITSVVAANWMNNRFQYHWSYWQIVLSAMALFILFKLVTFTPLLGWLIMVVLACIAFGSILMNIHWKRRQNRLAV